MLESLLEMALEKKEEILNKVDQFYDVELDPQEKWVSQNIKITPDKVLLSAGDGSIHKKKFLSFIFYAISAETLIYSHKLQKIENSKLDLLPHHRFVEDRLRNYMSLYEIKNALQALEKGVDYYLFDGSLLGNLIRPFPMDRELKTKTKREIEEKYRHLLERELDNNMVEISSTQLLDDSNKDTESLIYLENLENLLVIKKLLDYGKKLVAISKTSTRNDYFLSNIPDISLFDRSNKKEGYSHPYYLKVSSQLKREFPILDNYLREKEFTIFYARLEDYKNIIKIELPYHASIEEIENVLGILKRDSVEGYPYLLKKAHHDVVINKTDLDRLSSIMGFLEKDGREML
ncbi:DNA double-strand break repair nuclease NurA [Methanobacterium movens]